jgi:alkylated DNA repair dioxygenase AlkB
MIDKDFFLLFFNNTTAKMERELVMEELPLSKATVLYFPDFLTPEEANRLFDFCFRKLPFEERDVFVYGKYQKQPRKTCVLGTGSYTYSGLTLTSDLPIPQELRLIINRIEEIFPEEKKVNAVLCNLYMDGKQVIGKHADKESDLEPNSNIYSISLGAVRRFDIDAKVGEERVKKYLGHGSMLVMCRGTQQHYLHSVPKEMKVKEPRINLTFRVVKNNIIEETKKEEDVSKEN